MVSNEALNALLDQLAAISRREDQLAVLRDWIDGLTQSWDSERNAEQRENLGKLGGG